MPTSLDAPFKLIRILEGGGHVAMLVDQHYVNGVDVSFFGRPCKANPFIARLPAISSVRSTVRAWYACRTDIVFASSFRTAIEPRRAAEGRIDVQGTMQAITSVVEGWVREHPDQWLWVHRRWR